MESRSSVQRSHSEMKLRKIGFGKRLNSLFKGRRDNEEILSDIEELLITSDFGIEFTFNTSAFGGK